MPVPAPPIDSRSFDDLVAETEVLLQRYSAWRPANGDPGQGLVRIFARLAGVLVQRLNQVPEKSFLTFLNLLGLEQLAPQPARAPLTFHLAVGSPSDATVPARTLVAATPLAGETEPVVFETEHPLIVTRSELVAVYTREPIRDLYRDDTPIATGRVDGTFDIFRGNTPVPHVLYVGDADRFGSALSKDVVLTFNSPNAAPWTGAIEWAYWAGAEWQPVAAPASQASGESVRVTLPGIPAIPLSEIDGLTSAWLRGRMRTSLPAGGGVDAMHRVGLLPDALASASEALSPAAPIRPYGSAASPRATFYLACAEAFSKPGAQTSIDVTLDTTQTPRPSTNPAIRLDWEYWNGGAWTTLGQSWSVPLLQGSSFAFVDGTQALSRAGSVSFRCPSDWAAGGGPDASQMPTGFWLRARIGQGDFGQGSAYAPPVLHSVTVSYTWPLPTLSGLQAYLSFAPPGGPAELAFTNQLAVDLNKDFLPFGPQPQFNDAMYVASEDALSRPGARATLTFVPTNTDPNANPPPAQPSGDILLNWEFWNATTRTWDLLGPSGPDPRPQPGSAPIGFADATAALSQGPGAVSFTVPSTLGPVEVNGQLRHWIRVRIARGSYLVTRAHYQKAVDDQGNTLNYPGSQIPVYEPVPAVHHPPSIRLLTISYTYTSPSKPPSSIVAENDFALADLTQSVASGGQLEPFLPSADARAALFLGFARPGESIGFANQPTCIYLSVESPLFGELAAPESADAGPPAVMWEYWNGVAWARLEREDETQAFTRRGLVTFLGPPDFRASTEFGKQAFWLRSLWSGGGYLFPPRMRQVLPNTTWATNTLTILNEVLGSSSGERQQRFRTTRTPVLAGQQIEVREPELPPTSEITALQLEEGSDAISVAQAPDGAASEIWVRWHRVLDFYASGPRSRHYMLDALTGEVLFGDDRQGLVPQRGTANVRAAWYQTGGGPQGNRLPRSLTQLKSTVPYVDGVTNWDAADGGSPQETPDAVKVRGPKTLRHRDRAVTVTDIEDLALQASTEVNRAKAIPAHDSQTAGTVTLIVVPNVGAPRPIPSLELLGRVQDYLTARLPATADLSLEGPAWLRVSITAQVVPISFEEAPNVQTAILRRLATYLDPLTGGSDGTGWAFGRRPHRSELYLLIEATPGVDHVSELVVTEVAEAEGPPLPWFLLYPGEHQISMVGGQQAPSASQQ